MEITRRNGQCDRPRLESRGGKEGQDEGCKIATTSAGYGKNDQDLGNRQDNAREKENCKEDRVMEVVKGIPAIGTRRWATASHVALTRDQPPNAV